MPIESIGWGKRARLKLPYALQSFKDAADLSDFIESNLGGPEIRNNIVWKKGEKEVAVFVDREQHHLAESLYAELENQDEANKGDMYGIG